MNYEDDIDDELDMGRCKNMNNGDLPIHPFTRKISEDAKSQCRSIGIEPSDNVYSGLTKREHFAGMAMPSIITGALSNGKSIDFAEVSRGAFKQADALLKELDK